MWVIALIALSVGVFWKELTKDMQISPLSGFPTTVNPITDNPSAANPSTEKPTQLNTNIQNTK